MGYGHIQKINIFHKVDQKPEYTVKTRESIGHAAKEHTIMLL